MLHWIEAEDKRGFKTWERYVECGHWGLVLTDVRPRWFYSSALSAVFAGKEGT